MKYKIYYRYKKFDFMGDVKQKIIIANDLYDLVEKINKIYRIYSWCWIELIEVISYEKETN